MNPKTAHARAVAVRQVLSVDDAQPDSVDIRILDIDDVLERWETLNRTKYATRSLEVYRSRFRNAVTSYIAWLDKRPDWKTAGRKKLVVKKRSPQIGNGSKEPRTREVRSTSSSSRVRERSEREPAHDVASLVTPMIPYEVPLRSNLRARLVLPEDLTRADADRLANFIQSLAFDSNALPLRPSAEDS
jgi:hypothetical protein